MLLLLVDIECLSSRQFGVLQHHEACCQLGRGRKEKFDAVIQAVDALKEFRRAQRRLLLFDKRPKEVEKSCTQCE